MRSFLFSLFVAILLFSCSEKKAKKKPITKNVFYLEAIQFRDSGKPERAFFYFNKAKDWFLQANDNLGAGKCLVNMATISSYKGDYFGSQELALQALNCLDTNRADHRYYINASLNELGITSFSLKNYPQAISFYNRSLRYTNDKAILLVIRDNMANAYREIGDFKKSLAMYQQILKQRLSPTEFARVLTNFTFTKWRQDNRFPAAPALLRALDIRKKEKDSLGQNSSYADLSDYYSRSQPDSALLYARNMYTVASRISSPDDQLEALRKMIRSGPRDSVRFYFSLYTTLSDSIQTARSAAKNQFALIRYESEKNKADNLRLQQQLGGLGFAVFLLAGGIISGILWYRKRRQRTELEKRNAVQDVQIKTSKKVHDVVANGLHRVMSELEHQPTLHKQELLDKIDRLYQQSRDISHDITDLRQDDFHVVLDSLFQSYNSESVGVTAIGNTADLWGNVRTDVRKEIEYILQELMVNMKKHSSANEVVISFAQDGSTIHVQYTDDGVGFPGPGSMRYGNGLRNTENRIEALGGTITFASVPGEGVDVRISFPVA